MQLAIAIIVWVIAWTCFVCVSLSRSANLSNWGFQTSMVLSACVSVQAPYLGLVMTPATTWVPQQHLKYGCQRFRVSKFNYHCRMCYLRLSVKLIADIEHLKMMILTCVKEDRRHLFLDCCPSKSQLHHTLIPERVLIQLLIDLLVCS